MDKIIEDYKITLQRKFFSQTTINAYITDITKFLEFLPEQNLEVIPIEIMNYRKYMKENYKVSTVNRKITTLNNFFRSLDIDVRLKVERVHKRRIKDDFLTDKEYRRLLKFAINEKIRITMIILANTGVRVSELKYIQVENLKTGVVEIENKGKIRTIILSKNLINTLKKYCREYNIKKGSIIGVSRIYVHNSLKRSAANARGGLRKSKVHAHAFRHLFAVQFLKKNNNIAALADILGHSSLETTRIYTSLNKRQFQEMLEDII
ncbi:tyrosine-type recombinase/integrase [Sebaldella sp. S0638]|uniref:tyrosine-type recombinase/integrase n=1 Tax=Sebaldella sp. S0638 TaxID=2957809 RepID=UPI00209E8152|nr:tyrosine-type recombinase/integrase [Sebaldella sp. S0638]MCP1223308.1 tyrosine-type recombinase/integrase [Sebaldella sp. S0638]